MLVVGEDPELDARRFRRTENGVCLITQDMIDRLAMTLRSSRSPRRPRRWSRPAGSPTSPAHCRPRSPRTASPSTTLLPGYPAVMQGLERARRVHGWDSLLGEPARLLSARSSGQPLLVLDAPAYFARDGSPYAAPAGGDWPDNWRRFAALGRAAADIAGGAVKGQRFDRAARA